MKKLNNHPFHLVDPSPWPLMSAWSVFLMVMGLISWFYYFGVSLLVLGMFSLIMSVIQWWRDVIRESTYQGMHTLKVKMGLQWGMVLFIISEVFFFFSFFWAFFHSSLSPSLEMMEMWPPVGIIPFNPFSVPLLNTAILLASGASITWSHHSMIQSLYYESIMGLMMTIILGVVFTALQGLEYWEAPFTIADSIYGSVFFMATGFHGCHVIIGTLFLGVCLWRLLSYHFSSEHHFGFEAAAWYWHFVDVVWLFLYISIYWWGS